MIPLQMFVKKFIKPLGIIIDKDLKLDKHFLKLCSKSNYELRALSRISKLISFK